MRSKDARNRRWLVSSRGVGVAAATLIAAGLLLYGYNSTAAQQAESNTKAATGDVKRGEYLVTITGCNDCHTPWKLSEKGTPEPDMTLMLSGHPEKLEMPPASAGAGPWIWQGSASMTSFAGPWGVTYAANLTPDENTGLGIWTEEMFVRALRTGRHMGTSREIQPPMPWPWYSKMTDEDLKAIYAYLRSIPPITNHVPEYAPPPDPSHK